MGVGLMHNVFFGSTEMCELTHDYIPDNLIYMQPLLLALWPAFLLRDAEANDSVQLGAQELKTIQDRGDLVQITTPVATKLFLAAVRLRHQNDFWFHIAQICALDVKSLLMGAAQAQDDTLTAIEFLSEVDDVDAVGILISLAGDDASVNYIQEVLFQKITSAKPDVAASAENALASLWMNGDWRNKQQNTQHEESFHKLLVAARRSVARSVHGKERIGDERIRRCVVGLCRALVKLDEAAHGVASALLDKDANPPEVMTIKEHLSEGGPETTDDQVLDPMFWSTLSIESLAKLDDLESVKNLMSFAAIESRREKIREVLLLKITSAKPDVAASADNALASLWMSRDWRNKEQNKQREDSLHKLLTTARRSRIKRIRRCVVGLCRALVKLDEAAHGVASALLDKDANPPEVMTIKEHLSDGGPKTTDDQVLDPMFWRGLVDLRSEKRGESLRTPGILALDAYSRPAVRRVEGPNFEIIVPQLLRGVVVPFLGLGASIFHGRILGGDSLCPPTSMELARILAETAQFPDFQHQDRDLARVASYFEHIELDRLGLRDFLRAFFDRDYTLNKLHHTLARVARHKPLLIITTNYDDMIERAFLTAQPDPLPYHLVVTAIEEEVVKYQRPYSDTPESINIESLKLSLEHASIIYKMHGSINRPDEEEDHYVITEEDHVRFLGRMLIPPVISLLYRERRFLFMGFSPGSWHSRVLLSMIPAVKKSWAIQYGSDPAVKRFWERKHVDMFDMDLREFSDELSEQIDTRLQGKLS